MKKLGAKWAQNWGPVGTNRGASGEQGQPNQPGFCECMERVMGIEPTSEAWKASVLQLYDARASHKRDYADSRPHPA